MIYIETDSEDACYNFAVEDFVISDGRWKEPVLLFWRTRPTLMVGSFQNVYAEVNVAYAKAHDIAIVRRRSGGGTIYTDLNGWQFSYFFPGVKGEEAGFSESAAGILRALRALGVPAEFNGRNDITAAGRKISGNARHVHPQGVLHHGSLLFDTDFKVMERAISLSPDKVVSKGISSVRQRVANISEFLPVPLTALEFKRRMLAELLSKEDTEYSLSPAEREICFADAEKYRNWEWNYANGPKFGISRRRRFAGGLVECCLNVEHGEITAAELRGDFFANGDLAPLYTAIVGARYERQTLQERLSAFDVSELIRNIGNAELLDALID